MKLAILGAPFTHKLNIFDNTGASADADGNVTYLFAAANSEAAVVSGTCVNHTSAGLYEVYIASLITLVAETEYTLLCTATVGGIANVVVAQVDVLVKAAGSVIHPTAAQVKTALEAGGSSLATIAIDVAGLDGATMRGTDSAALASAWTATRAGYVDNLNPAPPTAAANATAVLAATVDMPGATDKTVSQVLQAAWAQSAGKWAISGTTLTLYAPDGTTAVATFTLDDADAPTTRTPV